VIYPRGGADTVSPEIAPLDLTEQTAVAAF
jgi:hypothetical protein